MFPDRRKTSISPYPSKFTDPNSIRDVEGINDEVQKLVRKTNVKGDTGWTRVLALSGKMSEEEISKWKTLIDHPVEFNVYKIVLNSGILSAATIGSSIEEPTKLRELGFRNPELRMKYRNFFKPWLDPSTGLPFVSESEMRYIQEKFGGVDPSQIEWKVDGRMDFIKRSQMNARAQFKNDRLYECITNGYDGPGLKVNYIKRKLFR